MSPNWKELLKSHIWIFNIGRGLSAFIRTPLNQAMLYDLGSSDDFSPLEFVEKNLLPHIDQYKNKNIAQRVISHPHSDHISEIHTLTQPSQDTSTFAATLHTCPHDKEGSARPEKLDWKKIKNPKGTEQLLEDYRSLYEHRNLPLQTICYDSRRYVPNLEYGIFYVRLPVVADLCENDQKYGNGVSLLFFYRHGFHTLLIPGDLNPEVFKHLLNEGKGMEKRYTVFEGSQAVKHPNWHSATCDQPSLCSLLQKHGCSILLAPHHGLESGFSEDLYNEMRGGKPALVAISEKRHLSSQDGVVDPRYQTLDGSVGQNVSIEGKTEFRYSVSTRNGHHILILFQGTGGSPSVFLEKDPKRLLAYLS